MAEAVLTVDDLVALWNALSVAVRYTHKLPDKSYVKQDADAGYQVALRYGFPWGGMKPHPTREQRKARKEAIHRSLVSLEIGTEDTVSALAANRAAGDAAMVAAIEARIQELKEELDHVDDFPNLQAPPDRIRVR